MSHAKRMAMPWAEGSHAYATPGSLIVRLALGEAPERIPSYLDVRRGAARPLRQVDGGPIDRVLRHFSPAFEVMRVHSAARSVGPAGGPGNLGFDATEHAVGLSRTLQIDVDDSSNVQQVADALRQLDKVEQAYPHYLCTTPYQTAELVPDAEDAWQARDLVRAAEAMAYEPGDPAVIVAVVDTGVAQGHREFRGRLRRGADMVLLVAGDLPAGVRLLDGGATQQGDAADGVGHGTACAGIIGAGGESIPPGLAGECPMLAVRVLGSALFPGKRAPVGVGAIADIDCGVKHAIDRGARVLNLSFGTPRSADDGGAVPHADVVRYACARGCTLVAASGNSGLAEEFSPACLDGVIAVGAATADGRPAGFSTRGPHVALSAPGVNVVSAGLDGYARLSGTSFAAPFVAAAAALLVCRAEARGFALEGRTIRRLLAGSARRWPADVPAREHGSGLLDACAALEALDREIDATTRAGRVPAGIAGD